MQYVKFLLNYDYSLQLANKTIKEMEARTEDLKIQVRQELMKNDNIEKV